MGKINKRADSNWEFIIFTLLREILANNPNRVFYRKELMSNKYLLKAEEISKDHGHKEDAQKIEQTMQRTLQNMRDKVDGGWVKFSVGGHSGQYRLTPLGVKTMNAMLDGTYVGKTALTDEQKATRKIALAEKKAKQAKLDAEIAELQNADPVDYATLTIAMGKRLALN